VKTRGQILLWLAQRYSAMVLAVCVVAHLITIIYAVRTGLSAEQILGRTRGNFAWLVFYATFVAAVAVHAPIGMRTILSETLRLRGAHVDIGVLLLGVVLALWGWRAVFAVFH
jgi:fumarate reductase subunit C